MGTDNFIDFKQYSRCKLSHLLLLLSSYKAGLPRKAKLEEQSAAEVSDELARLGDYANCWKFDDY